MIPHRVAAIGPDELAPLVRSALGCPTASVTTWACTPVVSGFETAAGVYRFSGQAMVDAQARPWSMILKLAAPTAEQLDPADWNYLERDLLVHEAGLLNDLPGGLGAPRCWGTDRGVSGGLALWLEEVNDEPTGTWSLARHLLAARHLGRFNGAYLVGRPIPGNAWLGRRWLRTLVDQAGPALQQLPGVLDHPLVRRLYPPDVAEGVQALWRDRAHLLATLDRLPQTFCHRDAFRRNLFTRPGPTGEPQTVAIDWVFAGPGAVGEEAVAPVIATLGFREIEGLSIEAFERAVLDAYVDGLRDVGWAGDRGLVRLGYALAGPLRYCLGGTRNLMPILLDAEQHSRMEQMWGGAIEAFVDHWSTLFKHLLSLAAEARVLMQSQVEG